MDSLGIPAHLFHVPPSCLSYAGAKVAEGNWMGSLIDNPQAMSELNDCEDQACVHVDHCVVWGCDKAKLERVEKVLAGETVAFLCCPRCGGSYGQVP